jgi:hypothetical protein
VVIPRRALALALRRLKAARVLVVNGPRQNGKSAILGMVRKENVVAEHASGMRGTETSAQRFDLCRRACKKRSSLHSNVSALRVGGPGPDLEHQPKFYQAGHACTGRPR